MNLKWYRPNFPSGIPMEKPNPLACRCVVIHDVLGWARFPFPYCPLAIRFKAFFKGLESWALWLSWIRFGPPVLPRLPARRVAVEYQIDSLILITKFNRHDEINSRSTGTTREAFPVDPIGIDARAWVVVIM